jgi:hypothetical protein
MYFIIDPENGTDMLPEDRAALVCHGCGMILNDDYVNPNYKARKTFADVSHTYDGFRIASQRFVDTIMATGCHGCQFEPLPRSPTFYRVKVRNTLQLTRPPELKFEEFCSVCDRYVCVHGFEHLRIPVPSKGLVDDIYRSDFKMGYRLMMFHLWITNDVVKKKLKAAKLKGLSFIPVPAEIGV